MRGAFTEYDVSRIFFVRIRIIDKIRNSLNDKFQIRHRCTIFIRSELKCKTHKNKACVFLTWTSLNWKWIVTSKKKSKCRRMEILSPNGVGFWGEGLPSLRSRPHANYIPYQP